MELAGDGKSGEHDGEVGFDRFGLVVEDWSARRFVDSGEKPEFIRTCEAKSLYYAGFDSLVKSLKNTSLRRFLRGLGR